MEVIAAHHLRFLQKIFAVTFLAPSRQAAVWSVVGVSDYAQGTFEIFNSAQSLAVMTGAVGNGVEYCDIYSTSREQQDLYLLENQQSLPFQ